MNCYGQRNEGRGPPALRCHSPAPVLLPLSRGTDLRAVRPLRAGQSVQPTGLLADCDRLGRRNVRRDESAPRNRSPAPHRRSLRPGTGAAQCRGSSRAAAESAHPLPRVRGPAARKCRLASPMSRPADRPPAPARGTLSPGERVGVRASVTRIAFDSRITRRPFRYAGAPAAPLAPKGDKLHGASALHPARVRRRHARLDSGNPCIP